MAYFPMYIDLEGKPCTVVGGGTIAAGKARWLLEFGASVTIVAPEVTGELAMWAEAGRITLFGERVQVQGEPGQGCMAKPLRELLERSVLVVAATDDAAVNVCVSRFCGERHIPVNVADERELCSFYFPAIVKRGDVVVAVSTGGESPALAAHLRRELEEKVPEDAGSLAKELGACREYVHACVADAGQRKQVFEELLGQMIRKGERRLSRERLDQVIGEVCKKRREQQDEPEVDQKDDQGRHARKPSGTGADGPVPGKAAGAISRRCL